MKAINTENLKLFALLGVTIGVPIVCSGKRSVEPTDRPNIIFILTDDQRLDAMGYAGNRIIQTPNMDRLAERGVYFKNALCTTPISSASRASILTGLYEREHRYSFQTGDLKEEFMNNAYPSLMKQAGYQTVHYGKLGVNYSGIESMFDEIEDYDRGPKSDSAGYFYKTIGSDTVHLTRYTGHKAVEFVKNHDLKNGPFMMSVCFSAPHAHDNSNEQYYWDQGQQHLYNGVVFPPAFMSDDKYFEAQPETIRNSFSRLRWTWRFDNPDKYQQMMRGYYRMISGVDQEIGNIINELQARGLDRNTVIIFMSDNGYFLGERQLADKWLMYDLSVRVPLIIFDPRVKEHRDAEHMALNVDIPATILDYAGVKQPESWHGQSLRPVVDGDMTVQLTDTVLVEHLWEMPSIPPSEGVRTSQWKYFRYVNDKSWEEMYDLSKDPDEKFNLAKNFKYQPVLNSLRNKTDQLIDKYAESGATPSGLTVEYIRNVEQVKVNDSMPEYGWIVSSKSVKQIAYQLLVASSAENLNNNIGDIWNSGKVLGSNSQNIEHEGKSLSPSTRYYWKIRIWDYLNRTGEYSPAQSFITSDFDQTNISTDNVLSWRDIKPVKVTKNKTTGGYLVDFGRAAFGTVEFDCKSALSDTLIVRLGEKLNNGAIDRTPGGTIRYSEYMVPVSHHRERYSLQLKPVERHLTWKSAVKLPVDYDVVTPFRYVEIDNYDGELTPEKITMKALMSHFDREASSFTSSDTVLNRIWDLCKYSIEATTFCGLYVDGDRERIAYEADAYINQLSHYGVDSEYAMAKRTLEHLIKMPTWPTEWSQHIPMIAYQDYLYTGDTELIERYYEDIKRKTLHELVSKDGLISVDGKQTGEFMLSLNFSDTTQRLRDIVDWPQSERDNHQMLPVNTVVNCFFYHNMVIMSKLAEIVSKAEDKEYFDFMAAQSKRAINTSLFDKSTGLYVDGLGSTHSSLHSNMFALAFGIVERNHVPKLAEFIKSRGMGCSVYGAQYLFEALYAIGEGQYALELMTNKSDRGWYNMIRSGSTITLEAWDILYKPNLDWNHAWGAVPANLIPRCMWGVVPVKPGFEETEINPQLGDLKHCSATIPTIKGAIHCNYQKHSNMQSVYRIDIPGNMAVNFIIPPSNGAEIKHNNNRISGLYGKLQLQPGVNIIQIKSNTF